MISFCFVNNLYDFLFSPLGQKQLRPIVIPVLLQAQGIDRMALKMSKMLIFRSSYYEQEKRNG